ncbi:Uncharacterized protein GBIM_05543 [Gryllus bimaculatus]|nr:Uncharacterized protein GBIM_05543 [Gryllus bimaculatus]
MDEAPDSSEADREVQVKNNPGIKQHKCSSWISKITVEPVMFFYMFAFALTSVVEQAFYVDKACRVNMNYSDEICSNLHLEENKEWNKKVQIIVSNFHQYNQIATHAVPIVLAFFLGSWSDLRGRKIIILMGLFGKLYFSCMIVVNALQKSWALEIILPTACVPSALTGADLGIFAGVFAYMADITTQKNRTFRVAVLDVVYLSTLPTGVALGKYLYASVTGRSFAIMFAINASMLAVAIIFAFWRLEWQSTSQQQPLLGSGTNCCSDFFDKQHVIDSVKALCRKRPGYRRTYLIIILLSMMFYTFQRDEKPLTFLYTQLQFGWTTEIYSDFKTFQSSAYVIGTLVGVPIMSRWLKLEDTIIIMVGAAGHGCARFVYAFAKVPWLFYIDNAVPLFSGVLYSQVYNASIDTLPTAIFWVTFCSQAIVFLSALFVHFCVRKYPLEISENEMISEEMSVSSEETVREVKD